LNNEKDLLDLIKQNDADNDGYLTEIEFSHFLLRAKSKEGTQQETDSLCK